MKTIASLSLDLDNLWSYMKTHGDFGWETFPSYLDAVVPRILRFFEQKRLKATFFVVGQDLVHPRNRATIQAIAAAGHEIGNHSFSHEPWLHLNPELKIQEEIARAEEVIECFTNKRPVGFRGPGYSFSPRILRVLEHRRYLYDASLLPTWIGPLARSYYFMTSEFDRDELRKRRALFGSFRDAFRTLRAHHLGRDFADLIEIPVTTVPFFRIPFHVSYLLYLAHFSRKLATSYFRIAISLCRFNGIQPSLLLHPPDFMSIAEAPALSFFPAMNLPVEQKVELIDEILDTYCAAFSVLTVKEQAQHLVEVVGGATEPRGSSVF